MTFGEAIEKMRRGAFVAREGWNGKNMFIYLTGSSKVPAGELRGNARAAAAYRAELDGADHDVVIRSHIDMMDATGCVVCGWLANQTDMLADDWYVREYAQNTEAALWWQAP